MFWGTAQEASAAEQASCRQRTLFDATHDSRGLSALLPFSVEVDTCGRYGRIPVYGGDVHARGPYGIPVASAEVDPNGHTGLRMHAGAVAAFSALTTGIVLVSTPFFAAFAYRRLVARGRLL